MICKFATAAAAAAAAGDNVNSMPHNTRCF
jgi:hypothetical protein